MSTNNAAVVEARLCLRVVVWALEHIGALGFIELEVLRHQACDWLAHFEGLSNDDGREPQ